jgi:hypothetical protein
VARGAAFVRQIEAAQPAGAARFEAVDVETEADAQGRAGGRHRAIEGSPRILAAPRAAPRAAGSQRGAAGARGAAVARQRRKASGSFVSAATQASRAVACGLRIARELRGRACGASAPGSKTPCSGDRELRGCRAAPHDSADGQAGRLELSPEPKAYADPLRVPPGAARARSQARAHSRSSA